MKAKKRLNMLGVLIGLVVIVFGVLCIANPADSYNTQSADYASFGADYYTYQYQATRDAVSNTAVTANNIRELGEMIATYAGAAFIVAGLLIMIYFSKANVDLKLEKELIAKPLAVPPAETVFDYTPQPEAQPVVEAQPDAPTETIVASETAE